MQQDPHVPKKVLSFKRISKDLRGLGRAVYGPGEILVVIKAHREAWGAPQSLGTRALFEKIVEGGAASIVILKSDTYSDIERVCVSGIPAHPFDVALSLRGGAYLCHGSAVYVHGLTEQLPRTIYVNKEQSPKPEPRGPLTQEAIDRAFSNQQRKSNYSWRFDTYRIVLISGKCTGAAGVTMAKGWRTTGLERTLIDITVRPKYAGGVFQVAQAFAAARERISVHGLRHLLVQMGYKYPYHQAIGFYLARAGWPDSELEPFRSMGLDFDFYLDYSMAGPEYDSAWRVFYPKGV